MKVRYIQPLTKAPSRKRTRNATISACPILHRQARPRLIRRQYGLLWVWIGFQLTSLPLCCDSVSSVMGLSWNKWTPISFCIFTGYHNKKILLVKLGRELDMYVVPSEAAFRPKSEARIKHSVVLIAQFDIHLMPCVSTMHCTYIQIW